MFRVPTFLGSSSIHGFGVFTAGPLPGGTLLWEFTPGVDQALREDELQAFPPSWREWFERYCYLNDEGLYIFCGDNARFMNHSPTPNCDDSGILTVTLRDIAAGEELTCDYRSFDRMSRARGEPFGEGNVLEEAQRMMESVRESVR